MTGLQELRLSLTEAEYGDWNDRAQALGLSVADFVRRAVSDYDVEATQTLKDLSARAGLIEEKSIMLAASVQAIVAAQPFKNGGSS